MGKKYFIGFSNMDDRHLRSNMFHHSHLIFYEGDTDEYGDLIFPIRVVDSYGFYSHKFPEKQSFWKSPFSFVSQMAGIETRLRGSYGEWRRENIHDLAYGRGLTGRLFEYGEADYTKIRDSIQSQIESYEAFFAYCTTDKHKEEYYEEVKANKEIEAFHHGCDYEESAEYVAKQMPVDEFKFSFSGNGNTCKVKALNEMESVFQDKLNPIEEYIDYLRGNFARNSVPRLTFGLATTILHVETNKWVTKGRQSKYPYISWDDYRNDDNTKFYTVDVGEYYIDKYGQYKYIRHLSYSQLQIAQSLKTLARLAEMNLEDEVYGKILAKCNHYLGLLAKTDGKRLENIANYADIYLKMILTDDWLTNKMRNNSPENLREAIDGLINHYNPIYSEEESDELRL